MRFFIRFAMLLAVIPMCAPSFARHARTKRGSAPLAGKVVLRDIPDKYNAEIYSMEMPEPDGMAGQERLQEIKSQIKRKTPQRSRQAARTTSAPQQLLVEISFVSDSAPGIPPDNYMAVSAGNLSVAVMNSSVAVHNAATGAFLSRTSLGRISAAVGLNGSNNYRYDPKVVYDPIADRFICVILNGTDQYNYILMGFSQSNDPAGGWNFYKFYGDYTGDTTWFDYPAIAITKNEFFLTGNKVIYDSSWQAGFTQSLIYQVRKEDGYNGAASLTYQVWDSLDYASQYLRCLYPLNPGDSVMGPGQYFLSNRDFEADNDSIFLVQIPDTIGAPDSELTITPIVASCSYGIPPDARQPDTAHTLATNDDRVLGGFILDNEIQFVQTSVDSATGGSCVYHGVITNYKTSPTLTGRLISVDTLDFGYPNISFAGNIDGLNESIISFDYSGPNTYPGFGALLFDGANYSPITNIVSGVGSVNILPQREQRWGDYSGSQKDWDSLGKVWVVGIYGRADNNYGNFEAKLSSPYTVGVPAVPAPAATPSALYPNPAMTFTRLDFVVNQAQAFTFFVIDMKGNTVDKITEQYCPAGKNVIQFNIAPLAPGNYVLKAAGALGENIETHTFTRQ